MGTLILYELKKMFSGKKVWVTLGISLLLITVTVGGTLFGSNQLMGESISNYEAFRIDRGYQEALDGRLIDDKLIEEMREAYGVVPFEVEKYSQTKEYQKYARPYSAIYNYIRQETGLSGTELLERVVSTDVLQEMRRNRQEKHWSDLHLTETEKVYWRQQEIQKKTPVTFRYAESYSVLISAVYTIGLLTIFMVSFCLAGIFPEEHFKKTDQLILCSKCGREKVFGAKFLVGIGFAFFLSMLFAVTTICLAFALYGAEGFDGPLQLIYTGSAQPISLGQAVLIAYSVVVVTGIFTGALVLFLSEVLRNSVGTLAIVVGIIILPMFLTVPDEYRIWAQLWSYLPGDFVAAWTIFCPRIVMLFGKALQGWQIVPVVYMVLSILFGLGGRRAFVRYQVTGR